MRKPDQVPVRGKVGNLERDPTRLSVSKELTLMTQVGSFVPARSAQIAPVDRIFTRIGASDDLVSGQSTFMVEMNEVAQILRAWLA